MKGVIQRLRAEIRNDREAIGEHIAVLARHDVSTESDGPLLAAAAVATHHLYGAVESILLRAARFFEGEAPEGPDWHQQLLTVMALEIPEVRPALVGRDTLNLLRQLLAFRHFFRHAYSVALDGKRLALLARTAMEVRPLLDRDLDALDALLAAAAAQE